MSRRTVFQVAFAGSLVALLASPGLAQFVPGRQGPYGEIPTVVPPGRQLSYYEIPARPEVGPMPREKPAAVIRVENLNVPFGSVEKHYVVAPPPPHCAFDSQYAIPLVPCQGVVEICQPQDWHVRVKETRTGQFMVCGANPTDGLPQMPRNLTEIVGEFVIFADSGECYLDPFCQNDSKFLLLQLDNQVRFKAPPIVSTRLAGQRFPNPLVGVTTIRWDESDGGWWVETIRVPQPRKLPVSNDSPSHGLCQSPEIIDMPARALPGQNEVGQWRYNVPLSHKDDHDCSNQIVVSTTSPPCCATANKLAGTWVREVACYVIAATISGEELKLVATQSLDGIAVRFTLTADCTLTKDGLVHGVITSAEAEAKGERESENPLAMTPATMKFSPQGFVDCPFSFRTRMTSEGLMVSGLKMAFPGDDLKEVLQLLGGVYKLSKDGSIPVAKPRKAMIRTSECGRLTPPVAETTPPMPSYDLAVPVGGTYPPSGNPSYPMPGRTMLPPQPPVLPPAKEWESETEPQAPAIPMSPGQPKPPGTTGQGKKPLVNFSTGVFGGPGFDSSNNGSAPTVPPPAAPPVCSVPGPQSQLTPSQPANVPAGSFEILAGTFAQMLDAGQAPPLPVAAPPAVPPIMLGVQTGFHAPPVPVAPPPPVPFITPCPVQGLVQGTCEIKIMGASMPACTSTVPAVRSHVGTWVRVVGPVVYTIQVAQDHMTVTATSATEFADSKVAIESSIMTADYHFMRDGTTAVGLITSFDARLDGDLPEGVNFKEFLGEVSQLQKVLTDKPLALSMKIYGDALVIGNVRLPEMASGEAWSLVTVLGGRYSVAGDKPLPKPKIAKAPMPPQCFPLPAPPCNPGYPIGIMGAPVGLPMSAPGNMPQGMYPMAAPPYIQGGVPQLPSYAPSMSTCPNPLYVAPSIGSVAGCGGVMVQPTPLPVQEWNYYGNAPVPAPPAPAPIPLQPVDMTAPKPLMPLPWPPLGMPQ